MNDKLDRFAVTAETPIGEVDDLDEEEYLGADGQRLTEENTHAFTEEDYLPKH